MSRSHRSAPARLRWLIETEAHHRLAVASLVGAVAFAFTFRFLSFPVAAIVTWDAFAISNLLLAWLGMFFTDAKTRVPEAHLQDSSRTMICFCLSVASLAGLLGAGVLLSSAKGLAGGEAARHIALAALTVVSSWLLVHTMLALHYTHVFYCSCEESTNGYGVGVAFPDEKEPNFLDFAYFSFVIGMTFQVSDVEVTSRRMRNIVLLHSLLSFAFNTVILALSVNLAATLF